MAKTCLDYRVLMDGHPTNSDNSSGEGVGMHRVGLLAYDGMTLLDLAGPADVFAEADVHGAQYRLQVVALGAGPVRTSSGVSITAQAVSARASYDTFVVPGADAPFAPSPELVETIRRTAARSRRVAAICTGSFLLAEAGLLEGLAATTHWRYADLLQQRYPDVTVRPDEIFVRAGNVVTSAGVTAGIDLALALVEDDHGAALARDVARALVVFLRRPGGQSQFSVRDRLPAVPPSPLRSVLDDVTSDPAREHTLTSLARRAGMSERHLSRLFRTQLQTTPARFVELTRIEAAQQLLLAGASVTSTAARSGFGSDETLRRAFLRSLGVTPSAYRERFGTTRGNDRPDVRPVSMG